VKGGDHEPATRAIHRNYRARVRLLGEAIERIDLFNVMLFRDAEGRAEPTAHACDDYVSPRSVPRRTASAPSRSTRSGWQS